MIIISSETHEINGVRTNRLITVVLNNTREKNERRTEDQRKQF